MKVNTPINELIREFLESIEAAEGTKTAYRKSLGYWTVWSIKSNRDLHNPVKADLLGYKTDLINSNLSAATIDSYLIAVRKFLSWLHDMEYIDYNPSEGIRWQRDKRGIFIKQALTLDEVERLLAVHNLDTAVSKRNYALIDLMVFTGLRCIETTRLNVGDIKEAANRWHLQVWRKGTNQRAGVISVPYDRIRPIRDYWKYRENLSDDQPVFVNHSPCSRNTRLTPTTISRIVKESLRMIGLDSNKYTAHSLRHTAATLAYFAGSEYFEIGNMLGHRSPRQTEHYVHSLGVESTLQGRATEKINEYVQKQRKNQ